MELAAILRVAVQDLIRVIFVLPIRARVCMFVVFVPDILSAIIYDS
jgi:hypothetical protein